METKFEIHSHLEKKHYVEYYRFIWRTRILWVVIYAVAAFLGLLLSLINEETRWIIYGCAFLLYAVWLYFRPWMVAGKKARLEAKIDETETVESVTKFGDEILDEAKHLSARVSYDEIKAIHISKHVIVLQDIRKMDLILDKNGFTKGTLREFLPFIQEKCPQLKLPKW